MTSTSKIIKIYLSYGEVTILIVLFIGVILWILRDPGFFDGWTSLFSEGYVADSTVAIAMALSLFFLPSRKPVMFGGDVLVGGKSLHFHLSAL